MTITITWQTAITVAAVVTAVITLYKYFRKGVDMMEKPTTNEKSIEELRQKHESDMAAVNLELSILMKGQLAALKGLAEQGCDGPVHEAIDMIEGYLNDKAHEVKGGNE